MAFLKQDFLKIVDTYNMLYLIACSGCFITLVNTMAKNLAVSKYMLFSDCANQQPLCLISAATMSWVWVDLTLFTTQFFVEVLLDTWKLREWE